MRGAGGLGDPPPVEEGQEAGKEVNVGEPDAVDEEPGVPEGVGVALGVPEKQADITSTKTVATAPVHRLTGVMTRIGYRRGVALQGGRGAAFLCQSSPGRHPG